MSRIFTPITLFICGFFVIAGLAIVLSLGGIFGDGFSVANNAIFIFGTYAIFEIVLFIFVIDFAMRHEYRIQLPIIMYPPPRKLARYFVWEKPFVHDLLWNIFIFSMLTFIVALLFGLAINVADLGQYAIKAGLFSERGIALPLIKTSLVVLITAEFSILSNMRDGISPISNRLVLVSLVLDASALFIFVTLETAGFTNGFNELYGFYPLLFYWFMTIVASTSAMFFGSQLHRHYVRQNLRMLNELALGPTTLRRQKIRR